MKLISSINNFGFEAMKTLVQSNMESNIFFSPPSAYFILSLLEMGAKGNTFEELKKKLGQDFSILLGNIENDCTLTLKRDFKQFFEQLQISTKCNSKVFHQFELIPNYEQKAVEIFKIKKEKVNFTEGLSAMHIMNKWVSCMTNGNIKELFSHPLPSETTFVLINTILFESKWGDRFDPSYTKLETFYICNKITCQVQMMNKKMYCGHFRDSDSFISLLVLPFKTKNMVSIFILPDEECNIKKIIENLKASDISAWYNKSRETNVDVSIPKLSLSNHLPLKECLESMKVKDLFTPYVSDLSNISDTQSSVTDIFSMC
uniref:Serpin 4 n=1 Tax=Myxobolus cerebralis TaxID=59783 RepID=A0A7M3V7B3_9CNID|nr:serpin 4 [Myxobolus cerebralis]